MRNKQFELSLLENMHSLTDFVDKFSPLEKEDKYYGYDVHDPDDMQQLRVYKDLMRRMKGMINEIVYLQQPAMNVGKLHYNDETEHFEINGFKVEEGNQMEALVKDVKHQTYSWTKVIMKFDEDAIYDAEYLTHGWYLGGEYAKYIYAPVLEGMPIRVREKIGRYK